MLRDRWTRALAVILISDLIAHRDRAERLQKMNMVIGAFFSEVGRGLLAQLARFDRSADQTRELLDVKPGWAAKEFDRARNAFRSSGPDVDSRASALGPLKEMLPEKRSFILGLLQNPNLLEHESFTNLLWAVHHLAEELAFRESLENLPAPDLDHLSGDIKRAYSALLAEWVAYLRHLKQAYPFIFSLAIRTNPFDDSAAVVLVD